MFVALSTGYYALQAADPLPYYDAWGFVDDLAGWHSGTYGLHDLFRPANEHRIALPRLLFFADWLWFSGRETALVAVALGMLAALTALVVRLAVAGSTLGTPARIAVAGFVVVSLCSGTQMPCLGWSFAVQFMAQSLLPALALAVLLRDRPRPRDVAVAIACAAGATFSIASSLLLWPLLLLVACVRPLGQGARIAIAGGGIACWLVYATGGGLPGRAIAAPVDHALRAAAWSLTHLGSAWQLPVLPSLFAGLAGVAALAGAFAVRASFDARGRTLVVIGALWAAYSLAIGHGRHELGRSEALADRYAPGPLLFWAALFAAHLRGASPRRRRAWAAAAAVLVALLLHKQVKSCKRWLNVKEARARATLSFWLGDVEPALCAEIGVRTEDLAVWLPVLRTHRVSIFAGTAAGLPGEPLPSSYAQQPLAEPLAFQLLPDPLRGGARLREVQGTLPAAASRLGDLLAAVGDGGVVVGLGRIGWEVPRAQRRDAPPDARRWFALIPVACGPTSLRWFLLDEASHLAHALPDLAP